MTIGSRRRPGALAVGALTLTLVACAPVSDSSTSNTSTSNTSTSDISSTSGSPSGGTGATSSGPDCSTTSPLLYAPGTLTVATDSPAYSPYFVNDDPTNGKGFESAVTYAVAKQLGFGRDAVHWTSVPFNSSYQPGAKKFDFDINQISITAKRAQAVTFSTGYYSAAQAIITLKDSPYAGATSLADFADARLGAQVGTTSLDAIDTEISPSQQPMVYDDTNAAKQALLNGQVDGIVADLPTAFYITAVEIPQATVTGQFQVTSGQTEEFGLLLEKGNPYVACLDSALATLKRSGTLAGIEKKWLSDVVDVPTLS